MIPKTREEWLYKARDEMRDLFAEKGYPLPENVRVSCGFPSRSAMGKARRRIGECWTDEASEDKHFEIFVSPVLDDGVEVLATLAHELVHAAVGVKAGHKGPFRTLATALGLEGKMTATHAGEQFKQHASDWLLRLGVYPHAKLDGAMKKIDKQGTRMLKVVCGNCGYTVRTTQKWIDIGLPICPCGTQMNSETAEEDNE